MTSRRGGRRLAGTTNTTITSSRQGRSSATTASCSCPRHVGWTCNQRLPYVCRLSLALALLRRSLETLPVCSLALPMLDLAPSGCPRVLCSVHGPAPVPALSRTVFGRVHCFLLRFCVFSARSARALSASLHTRWTGRTATAKWRSRSSRHSGLSQSRRRRRSSCWSSCGSRTRKTTMALFD